MKKLDLSLAISPLKQPILEQSLEHIQAGLRESISGAILGILETLNMPYVANTVVILSGCVDSGVFPAYNITAGQVYYNGEVYDVVASSGTCTGANVVIGTVVKTQASADPISLQPGNIPVSVHNIFKVGISQGLTGTGISDFTNWRTVKRKYSQTKLSTQSTNSVSYVDQTGLTYTTPNDGQTRLWMILYSGVSKTLTSNGDGTGHQIWNSTTSTELDSVSAFQDELSTTNDQQIPYTSMYLGTLPPNTVIKARFYSISGGNMDSIRAKLIVFQL